MKPSRDRPGKWKRKVHARTTGEVLKPGGRSKWVSKLKNLHRREVVKASTPSKEKRNYSRRSEEVGAPKSRLWDQVKRIKRLPTSLVGLAQSFIVRKNGPGRPSQSATAKELTKIKTKTKSIPSTSTRQVREKRKGKEFVDKVILADCHQFLKSLPPDMIDCTITCPPLKTEAIVNHDNESWEKFVVSQVSLLDELYRVTKPGGHLWYVHKVQHHGNSTAHPGSWIDESQWEVRQEIIWNKGAQDETVQKFWPNDERIYWLRKKPAPSFSLHWTVFRWGTIWSWSVSPDDKQFPIYLALAILHAIKLEKGSLIFDPYGRTGTTAKAGQLAKMHFLTTEIDEARMKVINDRLNTTGNEDQNWSSLISKQIANETLDLRDTSITSLCAK